MANVIETRGWWPNMEADMQWFIASCPNCEIIPRQRVNQETEHAKVITDPYVQPFQR
jgi:hypothetical protein